MARGYTLSEIAAAVGGHLTGDPTRRITGVNAVELAAPDQITWVGQEPLLRRLGGTKAGAVLIRPQWADQVPAGSAAILVERPGWAIIKVLEMFAEPVETSPGVHPTAVVNPAAVLETGVSVGPHVVVGARARIGRGSVLHAGVYVGPDARIGRDCVLWPNVVVRERCVLGDRVIVHPNATIGADGFGYEFIDGKHVKVPQIGNVEIADDVEIGANSCIDRAKFGSTRIGPGAKIDNLVQVAHNVEVGPGVILVAQVGLAGSAQVGAYSVLAGKAGVGDHVRIGCGARVAGGSCVVADVPDQAEVAGCMAFDARQWRRSQIALRRLPQLLEQVRQLARRVSEIESAKDHPEGS